MEQLNPDQQEQLKKCSTERLRLKLVQAGEKEEAISQMDRPKLLEALAQKILFSAQGPEEEATTEPHKIHELRLREIALEEKRMENRKIELQMEMRKMEIDREVQLSQLRRDTGEETGRDQGNLRVEAGPSRNWDDSLAGRTKRYGETLKHVLPFMPSEIAELPQFFDTVEKLYQVPADLQEKLLIPLLASRAKSVIGRMPAGDMEQYDELKNFLLAEFKLTPREYKSRFDTAHKNDDETYVLFAARLRNLLSYYLRSRQVDNFDKLCELLVSDRLKADMSDGPLNYVLSLEGSDWFSPDKVATLADISVNNNSKGSVNCMTPPRSGSHRPARISTAVHNSTDNPASPRIHGNMQHELGTRDSDEYVKRCFRCQSASHLARNCPRGRGRGNYVARDYSNRAQVNVCSTFAPTQPHVNEIGVQYDGADVAHNTQWEFSEHPVIHAITAAKSQCDVSVSPLTLIDVLVAGCNCKALEDSGAQIPVIRKRLFEQCKGKAIGSIKVLIKALMLIMLDLLFHLAAVCFC